MITVPILEKEDSFEQCYQKLLEERLEVNELMLERFNLINGDFEDLLHKSLEFRLNLIGELMDEIQCCINLLDKVGATEGEINGHIYKLEKRGWKFKKVLKIEGE